MVEFAGHWLPGPSVSAPRSLKLCFFLVAQWSTKQKEEPCSPRICGPDNLRLSLTSLTVCFPPQSNLPNFIHSHPLAVGQVRFYGKDRVKFFESITVADVQALKPNQALPRLVLSCSSA